ncbi:chitinase, partial [Streptomyces sp. NRRL F-6602]
GRNYTAKWWTQNERPGSSDVWADQGACGGGGGEQPSGFVVSEAQFNQMFPNRNSFYTYSGLTAALSSYPAFANTGSDEVKKREAAAFLANVSHETGGLVHIKEVNEANYPHYCDRNQPYGCPAGQAAW